MMVSSSSLGSTSNAAKQKPNYVKLPPAAAQNTCKCEGCRSVRKACIYTVKDDNGQLVEHDTCERCFDRGRVCSDYTVGKTRGRGKKKQGEAAEALMALAAPTASASASATQRSTSPSLRHGLPNLRPGSPVSHQRTRLPSEVPANLHQRTRLPSEAPASSNSIDVFAKLQQDAEAMKAGVHAKRTAVEADLDLVRGDIAELEAALRSKKAKFEKLADEDTKLAAEEAKLESVLAAIARPA